MNSREYLLIVCLVFGLGCSTTKQAYSGPKLPPDKVATISSNAPAVIYGLDGGSVKAKSFEVLPDVHTITVGYWNGTYRSMHSCEISFTARAGHTYEVYGEGDWRGTWHCWIEDADTGQRKEGVF